MVFAARGPGYKRACDDWITTYLQYAEYTEPPISFHTWTAIGCLSAALQRKVYMDWGMERVYPNLYVVLLGPAAQTRKSTALRIGEELVKELNIPMIGQDNSPEAVIRDMKKALTNFNDGSSIKMQSAVACFSSELAVFLGRQNTDFHKFLTDWWDCPNDWKRTTKHQGIDDINGVCVTLVGAMAPDWIPFVFTPESIGGGFTSRIMFISETKKAKTIVNPEKCPPPNGRRDKLVNDLQHINQSLIGPMKLTRDAEGFYEEWYERTDRDMLDDGKFAVADRTFHTYCGRRSTILRKVSMCLSASRSDSMEITLKDISDALALMEAAEANLPGTFAAVGRSSQAHQLQAVLSTIQGRGKVLRSDLLRFLSHDVSALDLEGVEKTLEGSRQIKITRLTENGDTLYEVM